LAVELRAKHSGRSAPNSRLFGVMSATSRTAATSRAIDISIVIPCHNEEAGIAGLAEKLGPVLHTLSKNASLEVVFVDDGSTDATWAGLTALANHQLPDARVELQRHETNRGLGAALRTGFAACHSSIIITTDSDSTYRFSEIPALLACMTPDIAVVTASPYHPRGRVAGVPAHRLILSRGSSLIYRTLVGRHVYTYTSLFRAYRVEVIRTVSFESNGFLAVAELLVNAMLLGYSVAEYPTVLHSRVTGTSKAKLVRTIVAHLRFQLGVLLRRLGVGPRPSAASRAAWRHDGIRGGNHIP
jgi:dolichol-phosphate mannosyltransferase